MPKIKRYSGEQIVVTTVGTILVVTLVVLLFFKIISL